MSHHASPPSHQLVFPAHPPAAMHTPHTAASTNRIQHLWLTGKRLPVRISPLPPVMSTITGHEFVIVSTDREPDDSTTVALATRLRRWCRPEHSRNAGFSSPAAARLSRSFALPKGRNATTLGGRGSRRAARRKRTTSYTAQQELRPPTGTQRNHLGRARLPPSRTMQTHNKLYGSAGASPSHWDGTEQPREGEAPAEPHDANAQQAIRLSRSFALPKGQHPSQCNPELRTGFCVDPFFPLL